MMNEAQLPQIIAERGGSGVRKHISNLYKTPLLPRRCRFSNLFVALGGNDSARGGNKL
jgi:hypothetical protein